MEGDDFPHQALPFRRGHSAPLSEFFSKKTGPQTHACIIPLYAPPPPPPRVACLCFCLCKITVVQVSSGQCNADRQARKRTAKHLCSPQRSFLSYNWLSCPACGFGYKNPLFQYEPPSSPARDTEDGGRCFPRRAAKWLPLSKGRGCTWLTDSSVCCEIARHLERPDRKKGRETRGEEMRREEQQREAA